MDFQALIVQFVPNKTIPKIVNSIPKKIKGKNHKNLNLMNEEVKKTLIYFTVIVKRSHNFV